MWCSLLTGFLLPHLLIFLLSPFYSTKTPTTLSFEFLDVFFILGFIHTTLTSSKFVLYLVFSWVIANTKKDINLHIPTNKIYISRHVRFDENTFPFTITSPLSSQSTTDIPLSTSLPLLQSNFLEPDFSNQPTITTSL
jgi:hypothetical protein